MVRRKGERPVAVSLDSWNAAHPVAHMIATGDRWFNAWLMQKGPTIGGLSKVTGIPATRLMTIATSDDPVSRAEVDALARAWSISSGDLIASIGDACEVVE